MITKRLFMFFAMTLILSSCQTQQPSPLEKKVGGCLSPVAGAGDIDMPADDEWHDILPSSEWEMITEIPSPVVDAKSFAYQSTEAWMVLAYNVSVYYPDTGELKVYQSGSDAYDIHVFLSRNDTIWRFSNTVQTTSSRGDISRYDRALDRFVDVVDRDGIFKDTKPYNIASVEEDQQGVLWFFRREKNIGLVLYSFDPVSLRATRHDITVFKLFSNASAATPVSGDEYRHSFRYEDIAIAPDGKIWISDIVNKVLLQYDPELKEARLFTEGIFQPGENNRGGTLYFDGEGRLWVDDRGWLDVTQSNSPVWHPIARSPLFIFGTSIPDPVYVWDRPEVVYQSSDRLLWFRSQAGMAVYDSEKDDWCLFTTLLGTITGDGRENLWFAADGKLYRRPVIK